MPDGYVLVRHDGELIDVFADLNMARSVAHAWECDGGGPVKVRPFGFLDKPDPLGEALNSGDGSYKP